MSTAERLVPDVKARPLASVAISTTRLADRTDFELPGCLRFENVSVFDPYFGKHLREDVYAGRRATVQAIDLVKLAPATLHADTDFLLTVGDVLIDEHIVTGGTPDSPTIDLLRANKPIHDVSHETVIVCRFGAGTWGHWIGELLPKIVIVEAFFPKRFRFAVPKAFFEPSMRSFRDSISAYGISDDRLFPVESGRAYRFLKAWTVTSIWSDHIMHPIPAEFMRRSHPATPLRGRRKVALLRQRNAGRILEGWDPIHEYLLASGFECVDIAQLNFMAQVQIFCESETIFSVLGSGLVGLVFSPVGVRVMSVAPHTFGDRFFYGMICERNGRYADIRGPVIEQNPIGPGFESFSIDLDSVQSGLEALRA